MDCSVGDESSAVLTRRPAAATVKHAGKTQMVALPGSTKDGEAWQCLSKLTGVPEERMKVMVKGKLVQVRFFSTLQILR